MTYITANTGHASEWPPNRLKPEVRERLLDWLKRAVRQTGPSPIPSTSMDCRIRLTRHPDRPTADSVLILVERDNIVHIAYVLCLHDIRAREAWGSISAICGGTTAEMPATGPWLLAALLPPAAGLYADTLAHCADFAGCIGTLLIELEAAGKLTP